MAEIDDTRTEQLDPAWQKAELLASLQVQREAEDRRGWKRWLIGFGALVVVVAVILANGSDYFIQKGDSRARMMDSWSMMGVSPAEAISVDLSQLGFKLSQVVDARDEPTWEGGQYDEGVLTTYEGSGDRAVYIGALLYKDEEAALGDFAAVIDWAGQNCGFYTYRQFLGKGIIDCSWNDGHNKILLNQTWILDVTAVSGSESRELVDQVLDSFSAHWQTLDQGLGRTSPAALLSW